MADKKAKIGIISVIAGMNASPLLKSAKKARKGIATFADSAVTSLAKIGLAIEGARKAIDLLATPLQLSAELEKTAVSFEVLLGSADAAKKMLEDLQDFAASTPFQFDQISQSAVKLLAFGSSAESIMPTLQRLGELSAALGAPFEDLADLFGKAKVAGRIMTEDLNQFSERGIDVLSELAKQFGVEKSEVKDLASKGKISFNDLEKAIISMTDTGGRYAGMMQRQSETLAGVWSTFKDNVARVLTEVGDEMVKTFNLKDEVKDLTTYLQNSKDEIIKFVKSFGTLGDIKERIKDLAPVFELMVKGAASMAQGVLTLAKVINENALLAIAALSTALAALTYSNPFTAVIGGLTLLVGASANATKAMSRVDEVIDGVANKRHKQIKADLEYLDVLDKINASGGVHADEMSDWQTTINTLNREYKGLGLSINKVTGEIEGLAAARRKLKYNEEVADLKKQEELAWARVAKIDEGKRWWDPVGNMMRKGDKNALYDEIEDIRMQMDILQKSRDEMLNPTKKKGRDVEVKPDTTKIDSAKKLVADLQAELDNFGKTKLEMKLGELIDGDELQKSVKVVRDLQAQLDAKKILVDLAPKSDQFTTELAKYQDLLKAGKLDQEQYAAIAQHLSKSLLGVEPPTSAIAEYNKELKKLQAARDAGSLTQEQYDTKVNEALPDKIKSAIEKSKSPLQQWITETNKQIEELSPFAHLFDDFQSVVEGIRFDALPDNIQEALGIEPDKLDAFPDKIKAALKNTESPLKKFEREFKAIIPLKDEIDKLGAGKWEAVVADLQKQVGLNQGGKRFEGGAELGSRKSAEIIAASLSRGTRVDPTISLQQQLLAESKKQTGLMKQEDKNKGIEFNPFDTVFGGKAEPLTNPFAAKPDPAVAKSNKEFDGLFGTPAPQPMANPFEDMPKPPKQKEEEWITYRRPDRKPKDELDSLFGTPTLQPMVNPFEDTPKPQKPKEEEWIKYQRPDPKPKDEEWVTYRRPEKTRPEKDDNAKVVEVLKQILNETVRQTAKISSDQIQTADW